MSSPYQHYSFDLWCTLIRSNPSFKRERALFFYDNFNRKRKTKEEIAAIFQQIGLMCNSINEKTGGSIDAEEIYLMAIAAINEYDISIQDIDISELCDTMEQLFFSHLPVVYSHDTIKVLDRLKQANDCTASILSNTGFIKGKALRNVLEELKLSRYFDFQIYSDEAGMSKPNKNLFLLMLKTINATNSRQLSLETIIHIGDRAESDLKGATETGINGLIINSTDLTIVTLLN